MIRTVLAFTLIIAAWQLAWADDEIPLTIAAAADSENSSRNSEAEPAEHGTIREQLTAYVEAFNKHDATTLSRYWTEDAHSVDLETGQRTEGREALTEEFASFFEENSNARLASQVQSVRMVRPDVAMVEGQVSLAVGDGMPIASAFSAVLVQEGGEWLISSSSERDLPSPATPYGALQDLEWLIGAWQDQSSDVQVTTTVRWAAHRSFLIRSFHAQHSDAEAFEGTQVIGWDPVGKQIRTWTFHSDGSFGEGTVSKNGDEWVLRMSQTLSDGRLSAATQVISRIDDDTISVHTIGQTIEGVPVPASDPVTVVRTADGAKVSAAQTRASEGVGQ